MTGAVYSYNLGQLALQSGVMLPSAQLVYQTFGRLNEAKDNAVLFPTWYSSKHESNVWLIGEGKALDPRQWFIIVPNLFSNGYSSSPSNTPAPLDRMRFPLVTVYDNVQAQMRLVREHLGVDRLALIVGRSMGAMAAFHWAALFPDAVRCALMLTGASRCSPHNYVFLAGLKAALTADGQWQGGEYDDQPLKGLAAFGRVYAGWMYSQDWYRLGKYSTSGQVGIEDYLVEQWDRAFVNRDANDLLAQLSTWQNGDVSANAVFDGDHVAALKAITARCIVMPSRTDLYFPPGDNAAEVELMGNAELRVIDSCHGHRAGTAVSEPEDIAFVSRAIGDLLQH
ncbi:alpha/beta fold hydrolase [Rhizobium lusitanum]|uniref:alpha/beta fold hydrolase n=1 Tax=Rhizobium lusitanum TaxID=293958 RepID=UPI00157488BD|nr:alpha/beta fold hydrolase [Rhizobium lusitanum]NTJ11798.1 alpha/beta fold hydrolase [Rhizobium lusitanum]